MIKSSYTYTHSFIIPFPTGGLDIHNYVNLGLLFVYIRLEMKTIFLSILLFINVQLFAQNHLVIDFKDSILSQFSLKAKLISFSGEKENIIDSFEIKDKKKIKFPKDRPGVYAIEIINFGNLFFVINSNEDKTLIINSAVFNDEIPPINDAENLAWRELNFTIPQITEQKRLFFESWPDKNLPEYKPALDTMKARYNRVYEKIALTYKGSYVSNYLIPLMIEPICEGDINSQDNYRCLRESFIRNWPLNDEKILNNPLFASRVYYYLSAYSQYNETGFEQCVLNLMAKTYENEKTKAFILDYLIDIFFENGPEKMVFFIYDNFMDGCTGTGLDEFDFKKVQQMRNFTPGTLVQDFSIKNLKDEEVSLSKIYKKGPTLLLFYSSNCPHCWEEVPEYYKLYQEYKKKGFQVIAIALDTKKEDWENFVNTNKTTEWINVSELKRTDSESAKKYYVYGTPTTFLIGKDGKLILKNPRMFKLEEWLKEY